MVRKSKPQFQLEEHVNDWVKSQFQSLKLKNQVDFFTESAIPDYLKEALKGRAKTVNKTNFGKPDFSLTKYKIPVVIENKLGSKKLLSQTKEGIKFDDKSVANFAVNGALYYATGMIASGQYHEAIAIGIAGDSEGNIEVKVYYVYGSGEKAHKLLDSVTTLDFLENEQTFNALYDDAILTDEEKHDILINSQAALQKYAKALNKLMHNHNVTAPQRVLYVSGMLLSMQDVVDTTNAKVKDGLVPDDLKGLQSPRFLDGVCIVNQIESFLDEREIPSDKKRLMLASYSEISKDAQRDETTDLDKEVSKLLREESSANKQIFTFIYHNIFLSIDAMAGHLDIMGEMYSEFLKYALGDGKEIGIVLTPPYITKMMATILNVNQNSKVMDLATGSAGFLISAMEIMIQDAETTHGKQTTAANTQIEHIKKEQLLGIELNAEMFTLAATNMILRGDGSAKIEKGNTFNRPAELYTDFNANKLLLNPPFSFKENGMPFIAFGLDKMEKGGLGAIIIQDSAGSGKAISTNKELLKKHSLLASIKMPVDLFQPMAGVQTSIYIFEAHLPHDFDKTVKFIDFRSDGYKRTSRALQELDEPSKRYADLIKLYKAGKNAKLEAAWNVDDIYVESFITQSGSDWNFDQHKKIETKPTFDDFRNTVAGYLAWEVEQLIKSDDSLGK
ncbi:type I restriction enzyme M protein [Vibrio crassostreae]|nr:type I restriction enzyme M protein [Vibrio crassostreae]